MTTESYDERLEAFARGKRLGRLTSVVGNPKDSLCDACGSTLPSTLFGLRDLAAGRDYFVGHNCLTSLLDKGLVARTRYRQTAEVAYRREMEVRANGLASKIQDPQLRINGAPNLSDRQASHGTPRRTVYIVETESHYQVTAYLKDGCRRVTGRAEEPRWRSRWAKQDGGLVLLEGAQTARPRALAICVLKACHEARSLWRNSTNPEAAKSSHEARAKEVEAC